MCVYAWVWWFILTRDYILVTKFDPSKQKILAPPLERMMWYVTIGLLGSSMNQLQVRTRYLKSFQVCDIGWLVNRRRMWSLCMDSYCLGYGIGQTRLKEVQAVSEVQEFNVPYYYCTGWVSAMIIKRSTIALYSWSWYEEA